jgi:hypothetical protein
MALVDVRARPGHCTTYLAGLLLLPCTSSWPAAQGCRCPGPPWSARRRAVSPCSLPGLRHMNADLLGNQVHLPPVLPRQVESCWPAVREDRCSPARVPPQLARPRQVESCWPAGPDEAIATLPSSLGTCCPSQLSPLVPILALLLCRYKVHHRPYSGRSNKDRLYNDILPIGT